MKIFKTLTLLLICGSMSSFAQTDNPFGKGRIIANLNGFFSSTSSEFDDNSAHTIDATELDAELMLGYSVADNILVSLFYSHDNKQNEVNTEFYVSDNEIYTNTIGLLVGYVLMEGSTIRPMIQVGYGLGVSRNVEVETYPLGGPDVNNNYESNIGNFTVSASLNYILNSHIALGVGATYGIHTTTDSGSTGFDTSGSNIRAGISTTVSF